MCKCGLFDFCWQEIITVLLGIFKYKPGLHHLNYLLLFTFLELCEVLIKVGAVLLLVFLLLALRQLIVTDELLPA